MITCRLCVRESDNKILVVILMAFGEFSIRNALRAFEIKVLTLYSRLVNDEMQRPF